MLKKISTLNRYKGDLVHVGGPDMDPPVMRDITYVLDRPTSRAYRVAYGTRWIAENVPHTDYIFYLDDDSFLNIRRLIQMLEGIRVAEANTAAEKISRGETPEEYRNEADRMESLVLGFMMETDVDMGKYDVCEMCKPCDTCLNDKSLRDFCDQDQLAHMSLGGCLAYINTCKIYNDVHGRSLAECVRDAQAE